MKEKDEGIEGNFKENIKEFYRTLNLLKEQQPNNKELNQLYFQQVFAHQDGLTIEKVKQVVSKYWQHPTQVFINIIESINNNNFVINEKEINIIIQKPNKLSTKAAFEESFKVSFEENVLDSLEIKLFKSIITQDQQTFKELKISKKISSEMKTQVLGFCTIMAAECRDIQLIHFLIKNNVDVNHIEFITNRLVEIRVSALEGVANTGFCNREYFDEELMNLLLANGADINTKGNWDTPYFYIIQLAPEDYALKSPIQK